MRSWTAAATMGDVLVARRGGRVEDRRRTKSNAVDAVDEEGVEVPARTAAASACDRYRALVDILCHPSEK